jgi:hypothetical protein
MTSAIAIDVFSESCRATIGARVGPTASRVFGGIDAKSCAPRLIQSGVDLRRGGQSRHAIATIVAAARRTSQKRLAGKP